jgi:hypothetical protein
LKVSGNRVLSRIFDLERRINMRMEKITSGWSFIFLYSSPNIIRINKPRRLRWAEHVTRMGETRNAYKILFGEPEGKRQHGWRRRAWEDNIKTDLKAWRISCLAE